MSTIIVSVFVIAILGIALRFVIRGLKTGGCSACPQKSRNCSCSQTACHGDCAQNACDCSRSQTISDSHIIKML